MITREEVIEAIHQDGEFRHGDIIISMVDKIPKSAKQVKNSNVFAYGEATGHNHRVVGAEQVVVFDGGEVDDSTGKYEVKYATITGSDASLTHEEHKQIPLPEGNVKVELTERRYDIFGKAIERARD